MAQSTGTNLQDVYNFCLPVPLLLENELVELEPFVPDKHAEIYLEGARPNPELYNYLPYGPFTDKASFVQWFDQSMQGSRRVLLFAVKDKTQIIPGSPAEAKGVYTRETFAGVMSLLNSYDDHRRTEIGHIVILKPFQRTHVLTNAAGLLLHYCLDTPEQGGLGLRRVQWIANQRNAPSVNAAKRLGFQWEGILRWWTVLPEGKITEDKPREDGLGGARHSACLSFCWDDWGTGGREAIDGKMVLRKKV